jgi:hypothetical protein
MEDHTIKYSLCFQGEDFVGWRRVCGEDGDPAYMFRTHRAFCEKPFDFDDTEDVPLCRVPMVIRTTFHRLVLQADIWKGRGKKKKEK